MSDPVRDMARDERVSNTDRRQFGWRTVFYGFTRSRRHGLRRDEDSDVIFLDWHHPWLFFLSVGTLLMSVADAFMTLELLQRGFYEANPFMAAVMERGTAAFVAVKLAMTSFGILTLVYLSRSRFLDRFRTGLFLTMFFAGYACLVCYEIVNLLRIS